jgi:beta-phosphoglucomutase-like phosphatase (HAD superfamily)
MPPIPLPAEAPPLHAVLFDMDGTLVDSEASHWQIWREVLARWSVELDEPTYQRWHAGMPTWDNAVDLVARVALPIDVAALAELKAVHTRRFLAEQRFVLQPGAVAALDWCAAHGLRVALVTGASQESIRLVLGPHGLLARFETLVGMDDVPRNKPHPDGYLLALQRLGLGADAAVALEDSQHGVAAARAAGLACLALPTPISAGHDFSPATAVLPNLAAATDWLAHHRTLPR